MPFACPFALTRRVGQASVGRHVLRLTELRHPRHPVQSFAQRPYRTSRPPPHHDAPSPSLTESARARPPWQHWQPRQHRQHRPRKQEFVRKREQLIRKPERSLKPGVSPLQPALVEAAQEGLAPPLHINDPDISATQPSVSDWAISLKKVYADETWSPLDEKGADSASARQQHGDPDSAYEPGVTTALQSVLARSIVARTRLMVNTRTQQSHAHSPPSTSPHEHLATHGDEREYGDVLCRHGYKMGDLQKWLTILTAADSLRAARLLVDDSNTPHFLYLYYLRRFHVSPEALRLVVDHFPVWYDGMVKFHYASYEGSRHTLEGFSVDPRSIKSRTFRAFIRLARHARRIWPEALVAVAESLKDYMHLSAQADLATLSGDLPTHRIAALTKLFNRALYLISEPVHVEPFKDSVHQEAAQAVLLKHMAEHVPALAINREGYRGVMRVQLAQAKTSEERQWSRLKSPSWPPWKEDRTGMDADVGLEYGISRAHQIANRMQEAGYSMESWERVALIYAGWDLDSSPTIQTRAIMSNQAKKDMAYQVWAARIRSTRTVDQAWACFLAYEDDGLKSNQDVFLAMFEKLSEEQKRLRLGEAHPSHASHHSGDRAPLYPGDAREIFPPPASLHQATYTKTPPPSVRELHKHMMFRRRCPAGRTLAFLANNATSLEEGIMYLNSSNPQYPDIVQRLVYSKIEQHSLDGIPDTVFAAVVNLLIRYPHSPLKPSSSFEVPKNLIVGDPHHPLEPTSSFEAQYQYGEWELDLRQPLARAMYLLDTGGRVYRPAWNALLLGLSRRHTPILFSDWNLASPRRRAERRLSDRLKGYFLSKHTLSVMRAKDIPLDVVGFRSFCINAENAAKAAAQVIADHKRNTTGFGLDAMWLGGENEEPEAYSRALLMLQEAGFVREQFWALVGPRSSLPLAESLRTTTPELPRLLHTPSPAILHAYIRVIGYLRDYDGLKEIVEWMQEYWPEIYTRSDVDRNGDIILRRCFIAIRVFLEGRWEPGLWLDSEMMKQDELESNESGRLDTEHSDPGVATATYGAPTDLIDQVREIVDSVEDWGGWASDEEAETYSDQGRV